MILWAYNNDNNIVRDMRIAAGQMIVQNNNRTPFSNIHWYKPAVKK